MNENIWEILHKPDTVVFFDIDGTLTSYNYGKHHAHHELDGTPEFRGVNIYADCKRLKPLYGIPASHCFYTLEAKEKPQIVMDKVKELFLDISPESVVLM